MALHNVLLMTRELSTVTAVSSVLSSNGKLNTEDICQHPAELASRLEHAAAPAALIDIDGQPDQILPAIEPLIRKFPDTRFIVLSGTMRQDLMLEAMQVGARHFLVKVSIASDLSEVLHRLCRPAEGSAQGAVITVLSSGGGCGATTTAVNLAAEFQRLDQQPTLLVDLDRSYGGIGAYLGLEGEYGVVDVLQRNGPIDAELVRSTALSRPDGLHALMSASREHLGDPVTLDPERLGEMLTACKGAYGWTVIDAPRVPQAIANELAKRSAATLILFQLTIKDLRVAKMLRSRLLAEGIWPGGVQLVVARYRKRGLLINVEQARRVLGLSEQEELHYLSSDYWAASKSLNMGKPLAEEEPRSSLRREIQKLAAKLHETARSAVPAQAH